MGGAEVFTHEITKRWVQAGHKVVIFTSEFPNCNKEEVVDGITIVRSGGRLSVYSQARRFYSKRFRFDKFDYVIDEINTIPFFTPCFIRNGERILPLIHQLAREYWFYETRFPVNYLGYHFFENYCLKKYRNLPTITVSASSKYDLSNLGFKKIYVVPEGLNFKPISQVAVKSISPVIVYSGRLKRAKRPDHAIQAFKLVKSRINNAQLWIIGDGPFRSQLEHTAGPGVRFFGHLDSDKRRDLIKQSWVLVNPSVREGWGLNITEANALGTPSVAYDVPGLRDSVVNGLSGQLVEAGNVIDLANTLIRVLNDHELRNRLSVYALNDSNRYNWDITAKAFLDLLNS
jgi:glycosyltransferase involved in cell wall biosynthesis